MAGALLLMGGSAGAWGCFAAGAAPKAGLACAVAATAALKSPACRPHTRDKNKSHQHCLRWMLSFGDRLIARLMHDRLASIGNVGRESGVPVKM